MTVPQLRKAFETLEIDYVNIKYQDLTLEYLKKRYRKMALKHHPDKFTNENEDFKNNKREILNKLNSIPYEDIKDEINKT